MRVIEKSREVEVEFEVRGGLVVSDPCYVDFDDSDSLDDGQLKHTFPEVEGTWVAVVETKDEGSWGIRVSNLIARKKGHRLSDFTRVPVKLLGVDSGQMFVGSRASLPLDYDMLLSAHDYDDPDEHIIGFAEGAVSRTGFGDGAYELYGYFDADGELKGINVDFIPEDIDGV